MQKKPVYFDFVNVSDKEVFTIEWIKKWERNLRNAYEDILNIIREKMALESPIQFFLNFSLLEEAVIDAIIGMRKITNSDNNSVENPNSFKIVAYLTYWWLRHKPVSTHFPKDYRLENVKIRKNENMSNEQIEEECRKLSWQLKHINEYVAAQFALTSIFDFNREICGDHEYQNFQLHDDNRFVFDSFSDMCDAMFDKFIYYLSYRAIAPKVIEHILEAYTIHPIWGLTGQHWNT